MNIAKVNTILASIKQLPKIPFNRVPEIVANLGKGISDGVSFGAEACMNHKSTILGSSAALVGFGGAIKVARDNKESLPTVKQLAPFIVAIALLAGLQALKVLSISPQYVAIAVGAGLVTYAWINHKKSLIAGAAIGGGLLALQRLFGGSGTSQGSSLLDRLKGFFKQPQTVTPQPTVQPQTVNPVRRNDQNRNNPVGKPINLQQQTQKTVEQFKEVLNKENKNIQLKNDLKDFKGGQKTEETVDQFHKFIGDDNKNIQLKKDVSEFKKMFSTVTVESSQRPEVKSNSVSTQAPSNQIKSVATKQITEPHNVPQCSRMERALRRTQGLVPGSNWANEFTNSRSKSVSPTSVLTKPSPVKTKPKFNRPIHQHKPVIINRPPNKSLLNDITQFTNPISKNSNPNNMVTQFLSSNSPSISRGSNWSQQFKQQTGLGSKVVDVVKNNASVIGALVVAATAAYVMSPTVREVVNKPFIKIRDYLKGEKKVEQPKKPTKKKSTRRKRKSISKVKVTIQKKGVRKALSQEQQKVIKQLQTVSERDIIGLARNLRSPEGKKEFLQELKGTCGLRDYPGLRLAMFSLIYKRTSYAKENGRLMVAMMKIDAGNTMVRITKRIQVKKA